MTKMTNREYLKYWRKVHENIGDDLAAVCFPDKPLYFNTFFDRIQKYAIDRFITEEKISIKDKKLLDIGCGRGRWLAFFREQYGARVTGIDLSDHAVEACKKKGYQAEHGSITEMSFGNDSFDFVSSVTVLLHLSYGQKEKAVSEISRVLKPGGKAILIESTWDDPSPHVFGMSVDEWGKLLSDKGMSYGHRSGHCFNLCRRKLPGSFPFRDFIGIHLDYPLEYLLMNYYYGKQSSFSLQHLMVFEK